MAPPVHHTLHKFVPTLSPAATPVINYGDLQHGSVFIKGSGFQRGPTTHGYSSYLGKPIPGGKTCGGMCGRKKCMC